MYKPKEGSTTHLHLGTTELQVGEYVELEFVVDESTDMEAVLKAFIAVHHYEEPIIHFNQIQTTRADYDPNSDNRNRWWNEKEA